MNHKLEHEVIAAIESGQKIEAIKRLRKRRGLSLKDAKQLVDLYCAQNADSNFLVQEEKSGSELALFIILCAASYSVYYYFG